MLHAVTVGVLIRTARAAKGSEDTAKVTPSQLLSSVRRDMEQAMRNRRMRLERERKGGLFEQRWQEVCDARGKVLAQRSILPVVIHYIP